jgi:hypothetical protein
MSGMVIDLRRLRGRGKYNSKARKKGFLGRSRRRQLELQVARIAALLDELLLDELEQLSRHSRDVPLSMLTRARACIRNVRGMPDRPSDVEDEGGPQPEVDRELLDRLCRSLDPYK